MHFEARIKSLNEEEFSPVGEEHALDHESAAEYYAEKVDSQYEYAIVKDSEVLVEVRKIGETEIKLIKVTAEMRPNYYGREIGTLHGT